MSDAPAPVEDRDHVLGAASGGLTLVEYGDFGCPHCFAAKLPIASLLRRYDSLRLVWRHFPAPDLHPGADLAAELSELAADAGRFWEAHDALLAGRGEFTREDLLRAGGELGLEREAVESCLAERTHRARVDEQRAEGEAAGVSGTPTFFLDGERVRGHWRELAQLVPAAIGARS